MLNIGIKILNICAWKKVTVLFKIFGFTLFLKVNLIVRSYSSQYYSVSKKGKKKKNTEVLLFIKKN